MYYSFDYQFQFPSNGKAYRKIAETKLRYLEYLGFNSLQTGKRIAREHARGYDGLHEKQFQFPSNGKAYRKSVSHCSDGL